MADPVAVNGTAERLGDVLLDHDFREAPRPVPTGEGGVCHGFARAAGRRGAGSEKVPQADHSAGHHAYRCYRRGPDGVHGLATCGPGARQQAIPALPNTSTPRESCPAGTFLPGGWHRQIASGTPGRVSTALPFGRLPFPSRPPDYGIGVSSLTKPSVPTSMPPAKPAARMTATASSGSTVGYMCVSTRRRAPAARARSATWPGDRWLQWGDPSGTEHSEMRRSTPEKKEPSGVCAPVSPV